MLGTLQLGSKLANGCPLQRSKLAPSLPELPHPNHAPIQKRKSKMSPLQELLPHRRDCFPQKLTGLQRSGSILKQTLQHSYNAANRNSLPPNTSSTGQSASPNINSHSESHRHSLPSSNRKYLQASSAVYAPSCRLYHNIITYFYPRDTINS
jgi:hypothetical protein